MASPAGKGWASDVWEAALWQKDVWSLTHDRVGYAWGDKVWGEGVWNQLVWSPAAILNVLGLKLFAQPFSYEETAEGGNPSGDVYTLPVVTMQLSPGSVLDLIKTLPTVQAVLTPQPPTVTYVGTVDEQTVEGVTMTMTPIPLAIIVELPVVQMVLSPQPYDTINVELPAVQLKLNVYRDGISSSVSGFKDVSKRLVKRPKTFVRGRARLITPIVDEIDVGDYDEE